MDYFPLFFNLKQRRCLVVGAGDTAFRKVTLLLKTSTHVTVIAPEINKDVQALFQQQHIELIEKVFEDTDLPGYDLVISATQCKQTNSHVANCARQHNIPINVVDSPELCDFIFPAIIDRSPVFVAVSSGGASPVLARLLRSKIESMIAPAYGQLAALADKYRQKVKASVHPAPQRRIFWEQVLQGSIAEKVFAGRQQDAEQQLEELLKHTDTVQSGEVYLIGAGPGAADLLTFRALRLMQQGDVILYDNLVSEDILELTRRDADKIYVGKKRSDHSLPQTSINQLLADLARQGKRVVRLKGGDPFIFGRGGEEIETLMQQGIPFQVVPGITAASGCATYAGIPLTHRDHSQSCTFVTGHLKDDTINLNWEQLARPNQTIVIYMGLVGLSNICQSLIEHGCAETHPVAVIQQGTTHNQKVLTGTLATMSDIINNETISPPTLVIIGTVVNLHQQLDWFNKQ